MQTARGWLTTRPAAGVVLGVVLGMVLQRLLGLSYMLHTEFVPLDPDARFDRTPHSVDPSTVLVKPYDSAAVAANWARTTSCKSVDTAAMYNWDELGGEHSVERTCHFTRSKMFGPPDPTQIAETVHTPGTVNGTLVLLDLYTEYGILSSKRGGSMLAIYRAGGHLKGDSASGDHYVFMPRSEIVSIECVGQALDAAAAARGCGATHLPLKPDSRDSHVYSSNIWCMGAEPHRGMEFAFDSHGTLYDAEYLLSNVEKNERMAKHGMYVHDAMRSLCFAPFNGVPAMVFDTPHIQAQLTACYGEDYLTPHPGRKYPDLFHTLLAKRGDLASFEDVPTRTKTDPVYMYRSHRPGSEL
jgi:hypothetical protein